MIFNISVYSEMDYKMASQGISDDFLYQFLYQIWSFSVSRYGHQAFPSPSCPTQSAVRSSRPHKMAPGHSAASGLVQLYLASKEWTTPLITPESTDSCYMGLPIPSTGSSLQKKATSCLGENNRTYTTIYAAQPLSCPGWPNATWMERPREHLLEIWARPHLC